MLEQARMLLLHLHCVHLRAGEAAKHPGEAGT